MKFEDDKILIRYLQGNRKEMLLALSWLKRNNQWLNAISILLSKFEMDKSLRNEVFYECLTEMTMNIRKNLFKEESRLKTYFEGIGKNNLRNRLSKMNTKAKHLITMENSQITQQEKINPNLLQEKSRQESIKETLNYLINQLKEECRKILGYLVLGYSMREIGEILNFKQQTIKNKASKCRTALREKSANSPQLLKEIKSLL